MIIAAQEVADAEQVKDWTFELVAPMGGAAGEAFTNPLASSGMPPAAVLAREAIQNSVDAHAEGQDKVSMQFVAKNLVDSDKAEFVTFAGLNAIGSRASELSFMEPNCIASLSDPNVPLKLLFIDDYNTTGLAGDPASPSSKFHRFLLSLGDGGKEHDEHGTGGSYGFGKSVYSSNSAILTIFAYSRTVDGEGKPTSILFGCGYYRAHSADGRPHTGRAWFGNDELVPGAQQIVRPLRDQDADELAEKLGFAVRTPDKLGTSVLIVDATVETADVLRGVEDWWWPRLLNNLLDVEVVSEDGIVMIPRPRKREDLRPFVEAFDIAIGKTPPKQKSEFLKKFNRSDNLGIGAAGFKVLDRLDDDRYVVEDARRSSVALIRSTLMVVAYHRDWWEGNPVMVGVFVADDDIDDILRSAEPPAHDRWDTSARRLQDATGRKRSIVSKAVSGIKKAIKQFQAEAAPPPPPRPRRLSMLERTLAAFLSANKRGTKGGNERGSAPISLTYEQDPRAQTDGTGQLLISGIFTVRLKSDEDGVPLKVRAKIACPVMEDGQEGELLKVSVDTTTATAPDPDNADWFIFDLAPHEVARFECRTEPYDAAWTVKFVPEIEPVESL